MLAIKAIVAPSEIHGKGLFADEYIPKGTIVSRWAKGIDKIFDENYLENLNRDEIKYIENYASFDGKHWYLSGDNGIYFNHSDSPNIGIIPGKGSRATWDRVAIKDIHHGEELTMNYKDVGIDAP